MHVFVKVSVFFCVDDLVSSSSSSQYVVNSNCTLPQNDNQYLNETSNSTTAQSYSSSSVLLNLTNEELGFCPKKKAG